MEIIDLCAEALIMAELEGHVFICSIEQFSLADGIESNSFGNPQPVRQAHLFINERFRVRSRG